MRCLVTARVTARVHTLIFLSRATLNQQIYHLRGKNIVRLLWRSKPASFCTFLPWEMSEEMEGKRDYWVM